MGFIETIILGIVEGITEFLPISSTAHLILVSKILNIQQTDFHKFFEVFIQTGAILAVLVLYFEALKSNKNLKELLKKITISFLPTAFLGFILYKAIKNFLFVNYWIIVFSLIFVGIIFIILEKKVKKGHINLQLDLDDLTYKDAFLIGVFQSLAVIPGVSRAGAVILGMMLLKFKRESSVFYSFLIAIPTIISAGLYDLYKTGLKEVYFSANLNYLILGFLTSFIFALFSIKWFINYLQKNNLKIFGWYRIVLGTLFLIYLLLNN